MMRRIVNIVGIFLLATMSAFGQADGSEKIVLGKEMMPKDTTKTQRFKNYLIAPKGEWQCGLSVMYADFSTVESDFMLLLQGVDAGASMLKIAPEGAYTFRDNHALGAKFQYTNITGVVDAATADLLGNFSLSVEDINASSRVMGASIFQRTYMGLDDKGRVGLFWDYILGASRSRTQVMVGEPSDSYSLKNKIYLAFAPGIVYFPMNNVSVQVNIHLAELSYNNVLAYSDGVLTGSRQAWKAAASLNLLGLGFGLTVHL